MKIYRIPEAAWAFATISLVASSVAQAQIQDFYPARAMRESAQGDTGVKINFRPDGTPESCEIIASSGRADLDEASCTMMMSNRRYTPRNGDDGKPIYSFRQLIKWRIPGYPEPSLTPNLPSEMPDVTLPTRPRNSPSITLPKEPKCRTSGC